MLFRVIISDTNMTYDAWMEDYPNNKDGADFAVFVTTILNNGLINFLDSGTLALVKTIRIST